MNKDLIHKIKAAGLVGRGGAEFPVYLKWLAVYRAMVSKDNIHCQIRGKDEIACYYHPDQSPRQKVCYVVVNGAEGEPGIYKDGYILANHTPQVLRGVKTAVDFLGAKKAYLFLRPDYFKKYEEILIKEAAKISLLSKLEIIIKPKGAGYIAGEESTILNIIAGRRVEPRLRPPYPTAHGLFGQPTLINNIETFYNVALVADGTYKNERFFSLNGTIKKTGVFKYPANWSITKILKESGNYPDFPFFVQVGGDASGEVLAEDQLNKTVGGAGSITIYNLKNHNPHRLLLTWLEFFKNESCGQCTPCREGTYRLWELANATRMNWNLFEEILDNLASSSFCALGAAVPLPIRSYWQNVINRNKLKI
ncbi:MAG: hypothetical protein NTX66_04375 [Candidatus Falkowbacteria bacterium]|nr:hypothetical protein [Candidatus Falkowbacteria bacterium]